MNSMNKKVIPFIVAGVVAAGGVAQGQIVFSESFETDGQGVRYTASTPFNDGTNDHWNRTDGTDIANTSGAYTNVTGSFFWAAEDTDDNGGNENDEQTLDFTGINISGFTDIVFSADFGAGNEGGAGASAYDSLDYIKVTYQIDGGGYTNLLWFSYQNNGDTFNEPIGLDTDFDGEQDGALLSTVLTNFSASIAGTGSSLDLKIAVYMDSAAEEVAFDNISITAVPEPSTYVAVAGLLGLGLVLVRRRLRKA